MAAIVALQKGTEGVRATLREASTYINITSMQAFSPRDLLADLNLSLDIQLVDEILEMVYHPQLLGLSHPLDSLSIYAICCILGQSKRLLAVDSHSLVSAGLPIERILMRVQPEIRLPLIERIDELISNWPSCLTRFSARLSTLKNAYLTFLTAKSAFRQLSTSLKLPSRLLDNHFKLLWLAYVEIKQTRKQYNTPQTSTLILRALLTSFLGNYLHSLSQQLIHSHLDTAFPHSLRPEESTLQFCSQALDRVFLEVLHLRQKSSDHTSLRQSLLNRDLTQRMAHDLFRLVEQKQPGSDISWVEQAIFLEIDNTYTPMGFSRTFKEDVDPISESIDFLDCGLQVQQAGSDVNNQNMSYDEVGSKSNRIELSEVELFSSSWERDQEEAKTEERAYSVSAEGTVSKRVIQNRFRIQALKWAQQSTHPREANQSNFSSLCSQIFAQDLLEFQKRYTVILSKIIERHCPECLDVQARCRKIMDFFLAMMSKVSAQRSGNYFKQIFGCRSNLTCFVCISTIILNYIYKCPESYSFDIVEAFGLEIKDAFIPINWIGKSIDVLPAIRDYLYDVEGRMLLVDLWKKGCGFELLHSIRKQNLTYLDRILKQRIDKQVIARVTLLCQEDYLRAERVKDIVNGIMDHRPIILQYNSLSLIILSAYAVTNRQDAYWIAQAVNKWRSIDRYIRQELVAKDYTGSPLPLEKFIKEIFYQEAVLLTNDISKEQVLDWDTIKRSQTVDSQKPKKREFVMGETQPFSVQPIQLRACKTPEKKNEKRGGYK